MSSIVLYFYNSIQWCIIDAEELLEKYAAGERKFHSLNLRGIDLEGANLERGDLQKS